MRLTIAAGLAAGALLVWAGASGAQQGLRAPAEVPPASYQGSQYVDSTGCIYIRAGVPGNVRWVPRVTRDRKPICGYQPSNIAGSSAQSAAPRVVVLEGSASALAAPPAAPASAPTPLVTVPATGVRQGLVVTPSTAASQGVSPQARVLPRHLYEQRLGQAPAPVPKGYRKAWSDDRLNPRRAEQSLSGHAQMQRYWTDTVPRRARDDR